MKIKSTYFFLVSQRLKNLSVLGSFLSLLLLLIHGCKSNEKVAVQEALSTKKDTTLFVGAERFDKLIPLLKGKNIAVVGNQTSLIHNQTSGHYTHLVDSLLSLNIKIKKVFSPEHGFRGKADAGEHIADNVDTKTGLPLISLYGSNKRPTKKQLKNIDIILFDLQDVGVRFYTYISTLHYVMEAASENNKKIILLDRPNPNAHYVDGPVLESKHKSFVGMHPVPTVYGMTIGEYAQMINGEKWLRNGKPCDLQIVKLKNYTHKTPYVLPVKPSPNLPNAQAVALYPSLCFFEGTSVSCGRGTEMQFQIFGDPQLPEKYFPFSFTPQPNEGAKHPKHQGKLCYGKDLRNEKVYKINLQWLIDAYASYPDKEHFFNSFFTKLAGTEKLQNQIELGYTYPDIRKTWIEDLQKFNKIRNKYLLYQ